MGGSDWDQVTKDCSLDPGDVARLLSRTADLLRQVFSHMLERNLCDGMIMPLTAQRVAVLITLRKHSGLSRHVGTRRCAGNALRGSAAGHAGVGSESREGHAACTYSGPGAVTVATGIAHAEVSISIDREHCGTSPSMHSVRR